MLELAVKIIMKMNEPERKMLLSYSKRFLDGASGAGSGAGATGKRAQGSGVSERGCWQDFMGERERLLS